MPIGDLKAQPAAPDTVTTATNTFQSTSNQASIVLSTTNSTNFTLMSITVVVNNTYTITITPQGQAPQVSNISYSSVTLVKNGFKTK